MNGQERFWRKIGIAGAVLAFAILLLEHFISHGKDLNPVDYWISEYVLSNSPTARILMHAGFVLLALSAFAVAVDFRVERTSRHINWIRLEKICFFTAALGLLLMTFCNTDPNDGRGYAIVWPPTIGNWHQIFLYAGMGGALSGMALWVCWVDTSSDRRSRFEAALLGAAICSTIVQMFLVASSDATKTMTRFGGVTERIVLVCSLAWVISYCARREAPER